MQTRDNVNEGQPETSQPIPGEFDILPVIQSIWRQAWIIAATIAFAVLISGIYLRNATYRYDIQLVVSPVQSGQGSTSRSLSGIASLAGIELPDSAARASFDLYLAGLKSRAAAERLASNPQLMQGIFASEWSDKQKRWHAPDNLVSRIKHTVLRWLGVPIPNWQPPTASRLHEFMRDELSIDQDKDSSLVTIKMQSTDPELARRFLMELHQTVDGMLRAHALARSTEYIRYVNNKLPLVTIQDYREALIGLLSNQERVRMMAAANVPFVAEPFGTPVASPYPTSPKPMLVMISALAIGMICGMGLAYYVDRRRPLIEAASTDAVNKAQN